MIITNQRHLFDIPPGVTYLNCAYLSPILRAAADAGKTGVDRKLRPWTIVRRDFFNELEEVRTLFAQLINAATDDVAVVPASSYAAAIAGLNLPLRKGETVIVLSCEHFSNVYQWKLRCREAGAELVKADSIDGSWSRGIIERIEERTAIVSIPQCHWYDGGLVDVEAVAAAARAAGSALVIDGTQSVGAMPFDVQRVRPSFLFCSAYKWLLGPYGLAFLYADPSLQRGVPLEHHSYNRAGADEILSASGYSDDFMRGARRYDFGERSNFITLPMQEIALRQLLDWGPGNIQQTLAPMVAAINERAADLGLLVPTPGHSACHFTGLRFATGIPATLLDALIAADVHISLRGETLRVSPYLYNSATDIDLLFDVLAEAMRKHQRD
jgi:selenocysteine lyase/cysteine desulfurase